MAAGPDTLTAMRSVRAGAALLALSALSGCASSSTLTPPVAAVQRGTVDRVVDGDTLRALVAGRRVRVRLLGVDAPELAIGRGAPECWGVESADAARALLPRGAAVVMRTDPTQGRQDRFGRLLAEVTVAGEARTVNERLVAAGDAEVFRGDGGARLLPALQAAERRARAAGVGLWGACR
jgi:micrococcal nuclease